MMEVIEISNVVLTVMNEKATGLTIDLEQDLEAKIKPLGIDSMQFMTMVIGVCEQLGIDLMKLNSMQISTDNTVGEFIDNFKQYV